jgi:hypothetical protein
VVRGKIVALVQVRSNRTRLPQGEEMNLEQAIKQSLQKFLITKNIDAVEVTSWEDSTATGGYCETCSYTTAIVEVNYKNSDGRLKTYTYDGDFGQLIIALDNL